MPRGTTTTRVLFVAEPVLPWLVRPPAVVDCSVLAAVLWAEPAADEAFERLRGRSLHAPALIEYELANVARSKCRSGVPEAVARAGLQAFTEQRLELHDVDPMALFALAQAEGVTAYDAAYLALALELKAPLLTFDRQLAEAATRVLGRAEPNPPP
jgi:predicted nucleic acid-binding protein